MPGLKPGKYIQKQMILKWEKGKELQKLTVVLMTGFQLTIFWFWNSDKGIGAYVRMKS